MQGCPRWRATKDEADEKYETKVRTSAEGIRESRQMLALKDGLYSTNGANLKEAFEDAGG